MASRIAVRSSAMRAGNLVDRVARHEHLDHGVVVLQHRLTAQAGARRQTGRLVEHVLLVLLGLAQAVESLLHDDMAGGARTAPAAGVLERHAVGEQDVPDRPWSDVALVRRVSEFVVDGSICRSVLEVNDHSGHGRAALYPTSPSCSTPATSEATDAGGAPRGWCKSRAAMAIHYEK